MLYTGIYRGHFRFTANNDESKDDILCEIEDFLNERGFELDMIDVEDDREDEPDYDLINDDRRLGII